MERKIKFIANGQRCGLKIDIQQTQKAGSGLTIDLQPVSGALELSIRGETTGSAGQCVDSIREAGAGIADIERLCDIWQRWHLNGMRPGTRAQMHYLESVPDARNFEDRKGALIAAGLQPDRNTNAGDSYDYGSAWLIEPLPDDIVAEVLAIADRLDGATLGEAPDISEAPELGGDMMDSRDIIAALEIYRAAVTAMGVDAESVDADLNNGMPDDSENWDSDQTGIISRFVALREMDSACESCGDWLFGETLVKDSYFVEYAQNLAEDAGLINHGAQWPNSCIDWDAAAEQLKQDYTSIEFEGETYWLRS